MLHLVPTGSVSFTLKTSQIVLQRFFQWKQERDRFSDLRRQFWLGGSSTFWLAIPFFSSIKFLTLHTLFLEKVCFFSTPKSCTSVEMKCVPTTTRRRTLSLPWSVGCAADKKSLLSRRKLSFPTKHELNREVDDYDAAKYFPPKEKGGNALPELTLSKGLIGPSGPASYVDYFIISLEVVGRDKVVGRAKAYLQERQCWSVILRKIHKNLYPYVFCYQKKKALSKGSRLITSSLQVHNW